MSVAVVRLQRRASFRLWLFLILGLAFVVVLLWAMFWRFAAQQAASILDAWIAREKAFHRTWTCPDRTITGFPFAIEIDCSKPHFDGMIFGRHYAGSLSGFVAEAKLSSPEVVNVKVGSPFAAVADDKTTDLSLGWDHLDILLGGLPQDVGKIAIAARGLSLKGHAPQLPPLEGRASRATATFQRGASSAADHAIDFHIALSGASLASLDAFFGNKDAADLTADGDITQASFDPARTLATSLDQWRAAGGHVDVANLSLTRGATMFQAHGKLGLDPAHRLQGRLDTKCLGFEPVLRRLGVDPSLIAAGSLLSALLGGGDEAQVGPQPLHLPVGFDEGHLTIGPVRTSITLPPVY